MKHVTRQRGFTLLEMMIVLGLLTSFCLFLAQILRTGVTLFGEGESGQDLADRSEAAASAVGDSLQDVLGPSRDVDEGQTPEARFLVTAIPDPSGVAAGTGPGGRKPEPKGVLPFVAASVRLDHDTETALLVRRFRDEVRDAIVGKSEAEVSRMIAAALTTAPRAGRGAMWLFAHPQGDPENAYLEVRRRLFLAGERIAVGPSTSVDALFLEGDGAFALPPKYHERSEVIATNVLHLELALWSQYTRTWDPSGDGGPERCWDSARAGHLSSSRNPRENFSLDLGRPSFTTPSDDVWPHYVQVTLVVDRGGSERPDALLARELGSNDSEAALMSVEHLPAVEDAPFLKIGSEWVQYRSQGSSSLLGLVRGKRGTSAATHAAGTRVRVGKTIVVTLPLGVREGLLEWVILHAPGAPAAPASRWSKCSSRWASWRSGSPR